jgi:hypothetical protein
MIEKRAVQGGGGRRAAVAILVGAVLAVAGAAPPGAADGAHGRSRSSLQRSVHQLVDDLGAHTWAAIAGGALMVAGTTRGLARRPHGRRAHRGASKRWRRGKAPRRKARRHAAVPAAPSSVEPVTNRPDRGARMKIPARFRSCQACGASRSASPR